MASDAPTIATEASCFTCQGEKALLGMQVYLLSQLWKANAPMADIDPAVIAQQSNCYTCYMSGKGLLGASVYLLNQILQGGGGGIPITVNEIYTGAAPPAAPAFPLQGAIFTPDADGQPLQKWIPGTGWVVILFALCFALMMERTQAATYLLLSQTNAFAAGITNKAKAYSDSLTNATVVMATNEAKAYTDAHAGGAGIVGTVSNNVASAGLLAVDSTKTNGIAATKAHITNAWNIFDGDTAKFVNGAGALSAPAGGGNVINSGASVVGMIPVYTDVSGTAVTPTNSVDLTGINVGTLYLSNMVANVVPVFDGNTNLVPSTTTTNDLLSLHNMHTTAGTTLAGPILTTTPTTNGPSTLELATAGWVRSLLANGSLLYNSTNVVGTAFDASTYKYVGNEPTNGSRSYTPAAGDYVGTVMTTNRFEEVVGPVHITTFFTSSGGASSAQYTLHPEIYYTYDTNSPTLLGDYAAAPQAITHGAITNQYDFVVSFPPIINTNGAGSGFYLVRRFKIDTKTGTDTLKLSLGTNGVNNTSSHIAFSQPEIAGANWVASGTTNSTLAGDAQPYSLTMGGTNVIGALAGKQPLLPTPSWTQITPDTTNAVVNLTNAVPGVDKNFYYSITTSNYIIFSNLVQGAQGTIWINASGTPQQMQFASTYDNFSTNDLTYVSGYVWSLTNRAIIAYKIGWGMDATNVMLAVKKK